MDKRKYDLLIKLIEVLRKNAETNAKATREMIKNNQRKQKMNGDLKNENGKQG